MRQDREAECNLNPPAASLLRVSLEDLHYVVDGLQVLMRAVVGRHDVFGFGTVHVRAPVRHNSVTGIR